VGDGKLFTYKYDKNGNRIWADDGNIRYEYAYDGLGRLTGISHSNSGGSFGESGYVLDELDRLTTETKGITQIRDIAYDKTDQVTGVSGSNSEAYAASPCQNGKIVR
jgi:hypothetical protein